MPSGFFNWSKTAGTNATADSSIQWQEGQAPSSVNDSARAMMARLAEFRDDTNGSIFTTGTSTAYVAFSNQGFTSLALMNNKSVTITPHVTSGPSPTLNLDGLGPKPLRCASFAALSGNAFSAGIPYTFIYNDGAGEFRCEGAGIADGAIDNPKLAAGAVTSSKIAANTITSGNLAAGAVGASAIAPSFVPVNTCMLNGTIVVAQGGGSMTIAIKTLAGVDPSATDPVTFIFRDATAAAGDYFVRTVSAPLSIVVPNLQTIGFLNSLPGRLWVLALDNAGSVELAVFNACRLIAGTPPIVFNIFPLHAWGLMSTQAIAAASSAGVGYSTTARNAAYVPLGYMSWEVGLGGVMGTAGNWNVLPSRIQIFQPGSSPLPGAMVQQVFGVAGGAATGSTAIPHDNTIPQSNEGDQYMSLTIAPSSSANALMMAAAGHFSSGATANVVMALFQGAPNPIANALAASVAVAPTATVMSRLAIDHQMQAGTLAATAFNVRAGSATGTLTFNGESSAPFYGGSLNSNMRITEVMA